MSSPLPAAMSLLNETPELEIETPETKRSETTPPALPEQRRGISRRNVVLGLVAAAAGALGGGLALFAHQQKPSIPPRNQTTPLHTYSGHNNLGWSVAWAPDEG